MSYLISPIGKISNRADTSFLKQEISTSVVAYEDSLIDYEPLPQAKNVVLEVNIGIAHNPDGARSLACSRVQYSTDNGATWSDFANTHCTEGNSDSYTDYQWHIMQYLYILPTWTGQRKIRLAARAYNADTEYTLGRSYDTYPSNAEGDGACPIISIYSMM